MTNEEKYLKIIEQISSLLNSNKSNQLISTINPDNMYINNITESYSIGFYGFDSSMSKAFQNKELHSNINDNPTYKKVAKTISKNTVKNNSYKYYINDENWLLEKLKKIDNGNIDTLFELPEIIICPYDVKFNKEVANLLAKHNIKVQRIAQYKDMDDRNILAIGDIIKLDDESFDQVVSENNIDFKNAMEQIEKIVIESKTDKYRKYYKKTFLKIQEYIDSVYSKTPIDNVKKLYAKDKYGYLRPVDMNIDVLVTSENVYDENRNIINKECLHTIRNKINDLMNNIMYIYQKRDITTYNHINGMLNLIDTLDNGLPENEKMTLPEKETLKKMIQLHDIGKLVIPTPILNKQDKLNDQEYKTMQTHVNLQNVVLMENAFIHDILQDALLHHRGINNEQHSVGYSDKNIDTSRLDRNRLIKILSILDVYDALTGNRPYKKTHSKEDALKLMKVNVTVDQTLDPKYYEALVKGLYIKDMNISNDIDETNGKKII
ncbi:MAG: HD domain-containing protein [Clostridium sp.]|nr:HD domain-containing protein [Clostridium sp.]MCM1444442.1 HD domain-containing protein [Candidatus Amulumruptor caecigallinarius]